MKKLCFHIRLSTQYCGWLMFLAAQFSEAWSVFRAICSWVQSEGFKLVETGESLHSNTYTYNVVYRGLYLYMFVVYILPLHIHYTVIYNCPYRVLHIQPPVIFLFLAVVYVVYMHNFVGQAPTFGKLSGEHSTLLEWQKFLVKALWNASTHKRIPGTGREDLPTSYTLAL